MSPARNRHAGRFPRRSVFLSALFVLAALVHPESPAAQAADLSPLHWMAGCWTGTLANGATYEEWWMPDSGGLMVGMARMTRDGRPLSFERMVLVLDGTTPVLHVHPSQNPAPTAFRMTHAESGSFVFENPEHDFPQRIRYTNPAMGGTFARIEGERGGQVRGLDFPLARIDCPAATP